MIMIFIKRIKTPKSLILFAGILIAFPSISASAPHRKPLYTETQKIYAMYPGQYDYVMFGDSITEWGKWQDMFPKISIGNRGIAGDDTAGMLDRIGDVERTGAKYVFIMAGTNDLTRKVQPEIIAENIIKMSRTLQAKGIKVIFQSTIMAGKSKSFKNENITIINNIIHEYAIKSKSTYLDLNKSLAPDGVLNPEYTIDDTHLTASGYNLWQKILSSYFKKIQK